MRTAFHEQLDSLPDLLSDMCGLAGLAMDRATQALLHADLAMAEQVFTDHDQLAHMQSRAEEAAFALLALQAPVAATCALSSVPSRMWPTLNGWALWHCTSPKSLAAAI